jgi:hypothetical protein
MLAMIALFPKNVSCFRRHLRFLIRGTHRCGLVTIHGFYTNQQRERCIRDVLTCAREWSDGRSRVHQARWVVRSVPAVQRTVAGFQHVVETFTQVEYVVVPTPALDDRMGQVAR